MSEQRNRNIEFSNPKKIEEYPQGRFVLEKNGIVVGAIYSQRIENTQ